MNEKDKNKNRNEVYESIIKNNSYMNKQINIKTTTTN